MRAGATRPRNAGGFTLIELLIGVAMLGLIAVAVTSVSLTGLFAVSDENIERQLDATAAQWSAQAFASDVQGSVAIAPECAPGAGVHLVTLRDAAGDGRSVEYRRSSDAPYDLIRVECGQPPVVVVGELEDPPTVTCASPGTAASACAVDSTPRTVQLQISRRDRFEVRLDGTRRSVGLDELGVPDDQLLDSPSLMSLGGLGDPLIVRGAARLIIEGDALLNLPDDTDVAMRRIGGAANIQVSGRFGLETGAVCQNCPAPLLAKLERFTGRLADPLEFLPQPDASQLPVRTDCPLQGDTRVCRPGVYDATFPVAGGGGGGVKTFTLEPGVYVLRGGLELKGRDQLVGEGVTLYNESGAIDVGGNSGLDLTAPIEGTYAGILLFQPSSNPAGIRVSGNAGLAGLRGTIYAPGSAGVQLAKGAGELRVGRVIGTSLSVSGNGTVIVDGG